MNKKLEIAFLHKKTDPFYTGKHSDNTTYEFLVKGMQRNKNIQYTIIPISQEYDAYLHLKGKVDAVILSSCRDHNIPKIQGLKKLNVPILVRCGDFHDAARYGTGEQNYHDYGVDCMFNFMSDKYFYKYYPTNMNYSTILFGVESSLYSNLVSFNNRIKDTILNSGVTEHNTALRYRIIKSLFFYAKDIMYNPEKISIYSRLFHPSPLLYHYYKLRSDCNRLDYVTYDTKTKNYKQVSYQHMLSRYRAAIAATTYYPTIKYWEIAAAGCLTFMEITDVNDGKYLGFEDKKTCVIINKDNYKKRFEEYLADPDNPLWEEIAQAGREYALQNFNNDKASNDLVSLIHKFL